MTAGPPGRTRGARRITTNIKESALHILYICTGNICRSPTAERLTTGWAAAVGLHSVSASSAGTRAVVGHPIHPEATNVLRNLGGDPADFAARQLTQKISSQPDLVLAMTRAHRDAVLELAPQQLRRTFTLAEAAHLVREHGAQTLADLANFRSRTNLGAAADIDDPIGKDRQTFERVGQQIADLLAPVLELCRS